VLSAFLVTRYLDLHQFVEERAIVDHGGADFLLAFLLRWRFLLLLFLFLDGFLGWRQRRIRLGLGPVGRLRVWLRSRLCTRWTVGPLPRRLLFAELFRLQLRCLLLCCLLTTSLFRLLLARLLL
jgi:hypothetical protein